MASFAPPTILVVEDEPLLREVLAMELSDAGYHVLEAEDGDAAIALLEGAVPIHLLLTDIRLPGSSDGWAVARAARLLKPGLPVIYATGYSPDEPDLVEGAHLLRKPFRPSILLDIATTLGVSPPATR